MSSFEKICNKAKIALKCQVSLFFSFEGSPAEKADLEVADEILEVNGESLENSNHTDVIAHIHNVRQKFSTHHTLGQNALKIDNCFKKLRFLQKNVGFEMKTLLLGPVCKQKFDAHNTLGQNNEKNKKKIKKISSMLLKSCFFEKQTFNIVTILGPVCKQKFSAHNTLSHNSLKI